MTTILICPTFAPAAIATARRGRCETARMGVALCGTGQNGTIDLKFNGIQGTGKSHRFPLICDFPFSNITLKKPLERLSFGCYSKTLEYAQKKKKSSKASFSGGTLFVEPGTTILLHSFGLSCYFQVDNAPGCAKEALSVEEAGHGAAFPNRCCSLGTPLLSRVNHLFIASPCENKNGWRADCLWRPARETKTA